MKKIISALFSIVPRGWIKDKIRQWYYNRFGPKGVTIFRKGKMWLVRYPDTELKFIPDFFPYHVLSTNYIFLHHFPSEPVDILLDAGAYIGTFSIYVKKRFPAVRHVIALEPDPENWGALEKNFRLNNLEDVRIIPAGLWSSKTELTFYSHNKIASSVFPNEAGVAPIRIQTDSLGNILKEVSGRRIFIKMNIEGAEIEALKSCSEVIRENKVHLAIASDHLVEGELTRTRVEQACKELNLSVTTFVKDRYITVYASNETIFDQPITV